MGFVFNSLRDPDFPDYYRENNAPKREPIQHKPRPEPTHAPDHKIGDIVYHGDKVLIVTDVRWNDESKSYNYDMTQL